jgi:hypothetical protein
MLDIKVLLPAPVAPRSPYVSVVPLGFSRRIKLKQPYSLRKTIPYSQLSEGKGVDGTPAISKSGNIQQPTGPRT